MANGTWQWDGSQGLEVLSPGAGNQAQVYVTANDHTLSLAVPEPETWAMMIFGMGAVGTMMRRRNGALAKA